MNSGVRNRIRIVVLCVLPPAGVFAVAIRVAEIQAEQMSGVIGALQTLMVLVFLGALASFWLYFYDRPRFRHNLFFTGLGFCLEGAINLAIALAHYIVQRDFGPSLRDASTMLLLGAVIAVEGYQRTQRKVPAENSW